MKKMLVAFTMFGLAIASAKTYDVTLSRPATVGQNELKSGEYRLELNGDHVVLRNGKTSTEVPVQVENEAKKNDVTSVTVTSQGGTDHVREIRLGGTKMKLVFAN
jgi:hypothetical protein